MSIVLRSPLEGNLVVTSNFGYRKDPFTGATSGHKGTDFGMPGGTPILAVADGVVIVAKAQNTNNLGEGFGYYVVLDHGGFYSIYAHMRVHPNRYVQLGNKVVAGQQIGEVGTTGRSTGNHLHLEIRIGDSGWGSATPVDPLIYLDGVPLDTTGVPDTFNSGNSSGYSVDRVPYNPSQIVGRRLSSLSDQPLHAYLNIYIGDKLLTSDPAKPNTIQSFEITRLTGTGDKATFTIFDDNWIEIEEAFSAGNNWRDVHIQYGYVDSTLVSDKYNMMLQDYSISFNSTGVILTASALSTGAVSNLSISTVITGTKNPTEAVKMICRSIPGIIVEDQNFDDTLDFSEEINMINDYPVTFIIDEIVGGGAVTLDGEPLQFHIDSTNRAYFRKLAFIPVDEGEPRLIRTYIYQKGYDSVVQDITFDIKGVFGGTTTYGIASGMQSVVIDSEDKSITHPQEDIQSTTTAATGEFISMRSDQSSPYVDPAGYNDYQVTTRLRYANKRMMVEHYEAQMTIIGDPTIKLLDDVRIINVTDEGILHHTSGIYKVKGIVDSIDNGVMMTSLQLFRNGDINNGVELINPKPLVK